LWDRKNGKIAMLSGKLFRLPQDIHRSTASFELIIDQFGIGTWENRNDETIILQTKK